MHIGVEVGARTLKAAWLTSRSGGKQEWHYVQCARSQDPSPSGLGRELAQLLRPLRRQRFTAALTLAAPTSYVRSLTLQVPDLKRLPDAVRDELPKLLPFDVERAQFQFRVRRRQPVDGQWECLISLAACEATSLQQDLEALWQAGWGATGVAPSALALVQAAKAFEAVGQDPVVLLDIGERRTTMVLVEEPEAVYARDVALGSDHLTEALMAQVSIGDRTVSLSREEAETLKEEAGIPDLPAPHPGGAGPALCQSDPRPAEVSAEPSGASGTPTVGPRGIPVTTYLAMLQPILEQLASEVRRTMTFGTHAARAAPPVRALISGEGARVPHVELWLSKQLGVPVRRLNCERFLGTAGATSAVACGLVLSQRSPQLDLQPRAVRQRWALTCAAALAWQGMCVLALIIWLGAGAWQVRHHGVSRQLGALDAKWKAVQPVVLLQQSLEAHTRLLHRFTAERGVPVEWFSRLARGFPNAVRLTHLSVETQHVAMEGQTQEQEHTAAASISEVTLWLKQARVCQSTQLGSTHPGRAGEGVVEFSLTCERVRD